VRTCKYLNNIVEQDHRAIKRRCAPMLGFKTFDSATITLAGVELAHRIRKKQFAACGARRFNLKTAWERALFGT
jgi:transposase-like protein